MLIELTHKQIGLLSFLAYEAIGRYPKSAVSESELMEINLLLQSADMKLSMEKDK